MKNIVINIILFQAGWFACVLTAAGDRPLLGVIIALLIIVTHLVISGQYRKELRIIIIAMMVGLFWDSLIVSAGWISYQSGMLTDFMAPYWIILMWALFATTLNSSLSWMKEKLLLSSVFGAVAGPLAYYAGVKLGALEFTNEVYALTALSIGWAIFTPLLLILSTIKTGHDKYIEGEVI